MADPSRLEGDFTFPGTVRFLGTTTFTTGAITNSQVSSTAAIDASKLDHRHTASYGQPNTAATTESPVIYVAKSAGTVLSFKVGSQAAAVGDSTVTFDLQKSTAGGAFATVLTGVVQIDSGESALTLYSGTLVASPTYVADDLFRVVITATIGTGTLPTGVFVRAVFDEEA